MSRETIAHLNTNTLIGNTDQRGNAWHYRAEEQGTESNHYPGPIPIGDVERRLFAWAAESRRVAVEVPAGYDTATHVSDTGQPVRWAVQEDKQAIARDDDTEGATMGIFAAGYAKHQYREWLLDTVGGILDDTLSISSAGLLRNSAVAWVEVSVPESITTPEGVTFRPNLLATTSFDGSIATTFKRSINDTVCDNTRDMVLKGEGESYKVKHSKYSKARLAEAREALAMVHTTAEDFMAEIAQLCRTEVTPVQWARFLDLHVPGVDKKGELLKGRSLTMADNKRDGLKRLWNHDLRVSPWAGTAHGVLQAVNTYEHHEGIVRGATRQERNQLRTVTGDFATVDHDTWATLSKVLVDA